MVEFLNSLDHRWLMLIWLACAAVGGAIFFWVNEDIEEKSGPSRPRIVFTLICILAYFGTGVAMLAIGATKLKTGEVDIVSTLILWGKLVGCLYLFLSLPLVFKMLKQTDLYKWVVQ